MTNPPAKTTMRAMVLERTKAPLRFEERPIPVPKPGQLLVKVRACAVCRTDLHIIDGELPRPKLPLIPGHEIIGRVASSAGEGGLSKGSRVGVPWLAWSCGHCAYCLSGR